MTGTSNSWLEVLALRGRLSSSLGFLKLNTSTLRGGIFEIVSNYDVTTNPTSEEVAKTNINSYKKKLNRREMRKYAM
jgi:hypothetical protein